MAVYLLKNRSEDLEHGHKDPYEEQFPDITFVPIMDYHSINLDDTIDALRRPELIDGIIVTSQRAVDALKLVLHSIPSELLGKPVYTVGPTTAQRLSRLGFTDVRGAESGSGESLASAMVNELRPERRFVFLAGEIHRPLLPRKLIEAGHSVSTKIVYRTSPNEKAKAFLQERLQQGDWIVFFSPSHTGGVVEFLRESPVSVNVAAIGPTTRDFLAEKKIKVDAVAPAPAAKGLRAAIDVAKAQH